MNTFRAELHRRGRRWVVKVAAQGQATAKVGTLGDAKRTAEALAQTTLIWKRVTERLWVGEPPTDAEFNRMWSAAESAWTDA